MKAPEVSKRVEPRQDFKWLAAKPEGAPLYPSPLRYPGAKRKLFPHIAQVLARNASRPELFIEPFAGGASVALSLLWTDRVESIGLVDADPLVSSFWEIVFRDSDWLIGQIWDVEISVAKWREVRAWNPVDDRGRALKCLFLNRTSFSGIMHRRAGPIGGYAQAGRHAIDCRFNRANLSDRIAEVATLADRVRFVRNADWQLALQWVEALCKRGEFPAGVFYYLDPPFFEKADKLYTHHFAPADHVRLRDVLLDIDRPWILSYDRRDRVVELYGEMPGGPWYVEGEYTASSSGGRPMSEAILTNMPSRPVEL